MAFNEVGTGWRKAALAGALLVVICGGPVEGAGETAPLPPSAAQALSRVLAAREMGTGIAEKIWAGFDPAAIPVLVVEAREGRSPFALLVGHPDPPAKLVEKAGAGGAIPVHFGRSAELAKGAASPVTINGVPTALYRRGSTVAAPVVGELPSEVEILAIIHHMIHVHVARATGAPSGHREKPGELQGVPAEAVALSSLESRILAEILYSSPRKVSYNAGLARQYLAVRGAREALMGHEASAAYREVERAEALPVYTEYEVLRQIGGRQILPPAATPAETDYEAFKYGIVWRLGRIFGPLLEPASLPSQVAARASRTGAAVAVVLDRIQAGSWRRRASEEGAPGLQALLAERLPVEAGGLESLLRKARTGFRFEALLALARERAAEGH